MRLAPSAPGSASGPDSSDVGADVADSGRDAPDPFDPDGPSGSAVGRVPADGVGGGATRSACDTEVPFGFALPGAETTAAETTAASTRLGEGPPETTVGRTTSGAEVAAVALGWARRAQNRFRRLVSRGSGASVPAAVLLVLAQRYVAAGATAGAVKD